MSAAKAVLLLRRLRAPRLSRRRLNPEIEKGRDPTGQHYRLRTRGDTPLLDAIGRGASAGTSHVDVPRDLSHTNGAIKPIFLFPKHDVSMMGQVGQALFLKMFDVGHGL